MKQETKNKIIDSAVLIIIFIVVVAVASLLQGCGSVKHIQQTKTERDSIRTEYRYIERTSIDTVYVELPVETSSIQTYDSISHLETSIAFSDARIENGLLFHSLSNKENAVPIERQTVEIVKDSIIYRDRDCIYEKIDTVYVDKGKTTMEKIYLWWFYGSIALILISLLVKYRKGLLAIIGKLI